jgi:pentafunctional AROM polypeptide
MDTMTDCFMTLAAVAAVSSGTTNITNIANQRVKECDRIAVMVAELTKCGVHCKELPTGISITGNPQLKLSAPVVIHCHDDHRIAMSFGVLGSVLSGVVANEKWCVSKTYPTFWRDIHNKLGVAADIRTIVKVLAVVEKQSAPTTTTTTTTTATAPKSSFFTDSLSLAAARVSNQQKKQKQGSLVIIGMRGAGKTSLGLKAAAGLQLGFVDVDHELERRIGKSIKQLIHDTSWAHFRDLEHQTLKDLLQTHGTDFVIACGGGIVERKENQALLKAWPLVVQVDRPIVDIIEYLNQDKTRPYFDPMPAWKRRQPLYTACSHYKFSMIQGDVDTKDTGQEFVDFCQRIVTLPRGRIPLKQGTFFLSLTFPDVRDCLDILPQISQGTDALELRVDLLKSWDIEFVTQQVSILRRHSHLPIIFTVRSRSQGGGFPNDEAKLFALLDLGRRMAVEYVDLETHWRYHTLQTFLAKDRVSKIIASHHCPQDNGGTTNELRALFHRVALAGHADIVKVVVSAQSQHDAVRILQVGHAEQAKLPVNIVSGERPDIIVLAMSAQGQVSRVLNQVMSPVTHPLLPAKAAPGQMSVAEIQAARQALGLLKHKQYCIFGSPVSLSPSPTLHNTAFKQLHLPGHYTLQDTTDLAVVKRAIAHPDFGGASVTIPLKEQVLPLLDHVSEAVKSIGACNTLIRLADGQLAGDNTDWVGICVPLKQRLPARAFTAQEKAVVVGAGGTARAALFALQKLGFSGDQLLVHNPRTPSKAIKLATEFKCVACADLQTLADSDVTVLTVVNTLPGQVNFVLPRHLLSQPTPLVALSASYYPKNTAFTAQAEQHNLPVVRGIDMLLAQGFAQFELWTGRSSYAAQPAVTQAVMDFYSALPKAKL